MSQDYVLQKIQEAKEKKLKALDLSGKKIYELPESISDLDNLNELYLRKTWLETIPESVGNLSNLTKLDLSDNRLGKIPESVGNLSNLTKLDLSINQLKKIPESIENLSNLTKLDLSTNLLENIPSFIYKMPRLITLSLSSNLIKDIPESIDLLSNLKELDLSENDLIKLPDSIGNLSYSTKLSIVGNPLQQPPLEIAVKGIQAIKEYFQQLKQEGEDYIYEAKLLIVGEAGAGKTSLANKLQNPQYQLQNHQPSTEGIDVIKWIFSLDNSRQFKVNIWDFGGQEIYHATHQFFLTKRSLYVLVADSRNEDTDFYYWLNIVELLSDNSPLLIINNEKQDRKREINERALRGQFTNIEKTLATNLKTNRGLEGIIKNIKDYIKQLPHIGQTLPKTWVKVRQALENDARNHISLQEYFDICENNGFKRLEDKLQLSGYLHDLGVCLHFQEEEDSLLYKTVILKPEWGTDAVYKVLDNKQVVNNYGCFTRKDLKNIWREKKYSSMRGELLELMKKFQLCHEISDSKNKFVAPQLLSDNQPEYDWYESNNLILRYAYPDFMPKGIVSRFIVIMHQYIDQQKYVWKTGVILNKDNTKAEVIEYYSKREIKIRMAGTYSRELLINIIYELDKIHQSYNRLKYKKLIPCNCLNCKDSQSPYFYSFERLRKFISDNQYKIQCQESYEMVNVLSLIDNIVNLQQLAREEKDSNQAINIEQLNFISKDIKELMRKIKVNKGNYYEQISRDYVDQSRNQNITDSTISNSGDGVFNLGDISGNIAHTINQLPSFENEPKKKELKQLLSQLQNKVLETDLDEEDKEETLEKVQEIAIALENSQDHAMKKIAKKAMKMLIGNSALLPSGSQMVTICNQLPELIAKIF